MRTKVFRFFILLVACVYANSDLESKIEQERFLFASSSFSFTTFTLIKLSTTTTSTFTTTSTCTTSTAALTTCTVGRRRRGFFYEQTEKEGRQRRDLFYDENEVESNDGTVFLTGKNRDGMAKAFFYFSMVLTAGDSLRKLMIEKLEINPVSEVSVKSLSEDTVIPLQIQPGFSFPEGDSNRFLLAFGTSTITSILITTSYVSLTAICSSTSGFPLCGGVGK